MAICEQCMHFRRVKPASQLLDQAIATNNAAVANALAKIQEDEQQQKTYEAATLRAMESKEPKEQRWAFRPVMSKYCGFREAEGIYLEPAYQNRGGQCTDFMAGKPEKRPCRDCRYRVTARGAQEDQMMEDTIHSMMRRNLAVKAPAGPAETLLNKHREGVASRKAFEVSGAYAAKGHLMTEPRHLDFCSKFSEDDEFVICVLQNPHQTCPVWEFETTDQAR